MRAALDIETACGVGCESRCEHALDSYRNRITVIGVVYEENGTLVKLTFRDLDNFRSYVNSQPHLTFVGHGFKFDLRTLVCKGIDLRDRWADDTLLMAATLLEKIPADWMAWYEAERARRNEALPRGVSHRPGSLHSLKCLAPYFLAVRPFWENPACHDNDEYVLQDCEYTLKLAEFIERKLRTEGGYEFYKEKLLPWTRMLLDSELRGISLDMVALAQAEEKAEKEEAEAKRRLDELWAVEYKAYRTKEEDAVRFRYRLMADKALAKAKDKSKAVDRYKALETQALAKVEDLNLDSPSQLSWLLKDRLKLDITDFDGEETTGKAVLQKLASNRADIKEFIRYRKARKLSTAFFPSYREMMVDGAIHCSFNSTGTRTGRLSSSTPNLQQVERGLHSIFVARPGYKLATYDMSAIEPRLLAYYTHDLNLWDLLHQGKDFHNYNTAIFFNLNPEEPEFKKKYAVEREVGKEVALALMYGAGVNRLMESAQKRGFVWGKKEAYAKLSRFKEFYEGVYKFREEVINPTLVAGEAVSNLLGRQFRIDDPTEVHMKGLNTLVQGSASDLVIHSAYKMTKMFRSEGIDAHVLLLVHDEIVTEIPVSQETQCVDIICDAMTRYDLTTPLGPVALKVEGKVADSWTK